MENLTPEIKGRQPERIKERIKKERVRAVMLDDHNKDLPYIEDVADDVIRMVNSEVEMTGSQLMELSIIIREVEETYRKYQSAQDKFGENSEKTIQASRSYLQLRLSVATYLNSCRFSK
jgi:hypothetical protein